MRYGQIGALRLRLYPSLSLVDILRVRQRLSAHIVGAASFLALASATTLHHHGCCSCRVEHGP